MIADHQKSVRLRLLLDAEGRPGLHSLLEEAVGAVVSNRFRLDGLLGVGRQSYIFLATDLEQGLVVIVKQCAFDYRNPLLYNRSSAMRLRQALCSEYEVLQACRTGHLPRPLALLTAPSPFPAAAESPVLANEEVFLVEEHIAGKTVTELALTHWPTLRPARREGIAARIAVEFAAFWEALRSHGWHYGDISADNLLVEDVDRLRVVDAGSAVPANAPFQAVGYTPAFTTPNLLTALREGRRLPTDLAAVLPMVAKVLHFGLTRSEPLNGVLPDSDDPALAEYSPLCRQALEKMLLLDSLPAKVPQAKECLEQWASTIS